MESSARRGRHCIEPDDGNDLGVLYSLAGTNADYTRVFKTNWLETRPLDFGDEESTIPHYMWWIVELWGFEVIREAPFEPVPRYDGPEQAWLSGDPWATRHTHLKARIFYTSNTARTRFVDVDIGPGIRVAVHSAQVNVALLTPPLAVPIIQGQTNTLDVQEGCIAQALVAGKIMRAHWGAVAERRATNTIVISAPPGATTTVQIPPGATGVRVWEDAAGAVIDGAFVVGICDPGTIILPSMPLTLNPLSRETGRIIPIPKHYNTIGFTTPSDAVTRTYSLVFEVEF